jgi:predicted AlkP superfamily pyrophosphatase or phosphodiesterase
MNRQARFFVALLAACLVSRAMPARAAGPTRVVMISVDGLMPDYWQKADALGLKVPNLRRLMAEGASARVVGVLPTVTYPSHTTLVTGVPPRLHGIGANTLFDPEELSGGAWRWYTSEIRVPTLVSAARSKGLVTASVSWPVSVGEFADYNLPEYWRPGSMHPYDLTMLGLLAAPRGILEAFAADRGRPLPYPFTDDERTEATVYLLKKHRPALQLLHIFDLDDAEHDHGPLTPQALAAVEKSDAHIGQVLMALDAAGLRQETLVAIVSDHGFLPVTQGRSPNVVLRDAGLLKVDAKGKIVEWQAVFHSSTGSAALQVKADAPAGTVEKVRALFAPLAPDPANGIREILGADEVRAFGGVDSQLLLNAREGFSFSRAAAGEWISTPSYKGAHGHVPNRDELHATLILSGPGFARKGDLGIVPMTRIAPTLARALGITLSPEADRPLP